jgi:hypothetical protein
MFETEQDPFYPSMRRYVIHDNPQVTGKPIEGIAGGRIVAYWPTDLEIECGIRSLTGGYIPAMLVATWQQPGAVPTTSLCNIRLMVDEANVNLPVAVAKCSEKGIGWYSGSTRCSAQYSEVPAKGCWTWIPKA